MPARRRSRIIVPTDRRCGGRRSNSRPLRRKFDTPSTLDYRATGTTDWCFCCRHSSSLSIRRVSPSDSGVYHCLATNVVGSARSASLELIVEPGTQQCRRFHSVSKPYLTCTVKGKGFPYSLPNVGPGADPGVQTISPQVTISHPPGGRLPLLSARLAVTFPAAEHDRV